MDRDCTEPAPMAEATTLEKETGYPALEIDYALYESYLEGSEWTDAQKREFIETLWSIVVQFVDFGIGLHPVQQAGTSVDIPEEFLSPANPKKLDSGKNLKDQLSVAADRGNSSSGAKEVR